MEAAAMASYLPSPFTTPVWGMSGYGLNLRLRIQLFDSPVHGQKRSIENIDAVDFFGGDDTDGPCYGFLFDNGTQLVALLFG